MAHIITKENIYDFHRFLMNSEKSKSTADKYFKSLENLYIWLNSKELVKENLIAYRRYLSQRYNPRTVNCNLSAINSYLDMYNLSSEKVKFVKIQQSHFIPENRELTQSDYQKLLKACNNKRLYFIIMTLCSTGIRISELKYITLQSVKDGRADIQNKGKFRTILLPRDLCRKLLKYAKDNNITEGYIFRTKSGKPVDRSNIHHRMKKICDRAKVEKRKVFPHNFRHLFAKIFYRTEKNISFLADILGHKSIETTRIYVTATAKEHLKILNKMKLVI